METIGQLLSLPVAAARRQELVQTAYELARILPDELALVVELAPKPILESGSYALHSMQSFGLRDVGVCSSGLLASSERKSFWRAQGWPGRYRQAVCVSEITLPRETSLRCF